ncbi:FAD-dependent monooxygenase [Lysobacter korlensis]|uniref:FAD-dependent monooxygenase n=1 Tax=Lysobacter korlensis TaxID=553636 RepID=A0ABV6RTH7_9GAMM
MAEQTTDVLVVGAGPTGLMLVNCLAKLGVSALLIDGKPGPTRESRALGVQARTMELYDQLGMADRVLARCTPARGVVPGYRGTAFRAVSLPALGGRVSPFPRMYVLEQSANEELLVENLRRLGGEVRWNSALLSLELLDGVRPVRAVLSDGSVRARFCVGTDGTSSLVRKLRGIPFEGETNPYTYFVLDGVRAQGIVPGHINIRMAPLDFLLAFPMGGEDARLLGVVRNPTGEAVAEEAVRPRLSDVFSVTYERARWFSTYRVHHRIAAEFRDGPFFLAGDAAHVHSPVGAQGMNTGMQDAHNLAYKLGDVLTGRAGERSLDRYGAERRPVALRLVSTTDRIFGAVTSEHGLARFVRSRVMPVAGRFAVRVVPRLPFGARLFSYLSQTRIHYWMSPEAEWASRGRRGRVVGRRLRWSGENFACLRSFTWQVHAYSRALRSAAEATAARLGVDVQVFASPGFSAELRRDRLYLVRPDGFVAAAGSPAHALIRFATVLEQLRD